MARRGGKGTNTKAGLALRKKGRRTTKYQDPDEDDDLDFGPVSLEHEHSSVEPVDDDDDFEPEHPVMVVVPPRPRSKRSPPSDKGKEEADDDDHDDRRTTRSKRHRYRSPPPDDEDAVLVEASDDDNDEAPQQDEPRTETVTLEEISHAAKTNIAYLDALVRVATYYRSIDVNQKNPTYDEPIRQVETDMEDTLRALRDCPMPIMQIGRLSMRCLPRFPTPTGASFDSPMSPSPLGSSGAMCPRPRRRRSTPVLRNCTVTSTAVHL